MIWGNIYVCLLCFLFSDFLSYSFQCTDLSNPFLRSFDSFWFSFADNVTTGKYHFVSFIVKIILSELASTLSAPAADKTQWFVFLRFNSTLKLINGISGDLQKLLGSFSDMAIVLSFMIPFVSSATVFYNNLTTDFKDLKVLPSTILALKLVTSSLKLPVVSE